MLNLTSELRTLLRVLSHLETNYGTPLSLVAIAQNCGRSPYNVRQEVLDVGIQSGWIRVQRGRSGGYLLVRHLTELSVQELLATFHVAVSCSLCSDTGECPIGPPWQAACEQLALIRRQTSVLELAQALIPMLPNSNAIVVSEASKSLVSSFARECTTRFRQECAIRFRPNCTTDKIVTQIAPPANRRYCLITRSSGVPLEATQHQQMPLWNPGHPGNDTHPSDDRPDNEADTDYDAASATGSDNTSSPESPDDSTAWL